MFQEKDAHAAVEKLKSPRSAKKVKNPKILKPRLYHQKEALNFPIKSAEKALIHNNGATGCGKTFVNMILALRAIIEIILPRMKQKKEKATNIKIVYVAPFISTVEQTYNVIKSELKGCIEEVVKTHSNAIFGSASKARAARQLKADISVCTWKKLEMILTQAPGQKTALANLRNCVLILDDASQYLNSRNALCYLALLDQLRRENNVVVILASGSLPHYEKIPNYLPESITIARLGEGTKTMPEVKNRCKIQAETRPISVDHLIKKIKKHGLPAMLVLETVRKSIIVFSELKAAFPNAKLYLLNGKMSRHDRAKSIKSIEDALKKKRKNVLVVATSMTVSGWDVSYLSGFNDIFSVANLLEQRGRNNRAWEFPKGAIIYTAPLVIPGVRNNSQVEIQKAVALEMIDSKEIYDIEAPTLAAQKELTAKKNTWLKEAKLLYKLVKNHQWKELAALNPSGYHHKKESTALPNFSSCPALAKRLIQALKEKGITAQIVRENRIQTDATLTKEAIEEILEVLASASDDFSMLLSEADIKELETFGDSFYELEIQGKRNKVEYTKLTLLTRKSFGHLAKKLGIID